MSANNPPQPDLTTIRDMLRDGARDMRWSIIVASSLAAIYLCAGIPLVGFTWNALGSAAPFGLGLVALDGFQVMIVAIGALVGYRVSGRTQLNLAECIARLEKREDEHERTGAVRARQVGELTATNKLLAEQVKILTEQVADLRDVLEGGVAKLNTDKLNNVREHRR